MVGTGNMGKIDERLEGLEPGTLRHQVMTALRQFRASWVELGRLLNEVVYGGDYKEWGYDDFEVYCARDTRLGRMRVPRRFRAHIEVVAAPAVDGTATDAAALEARVRALRGDDA